MQKLKTLLNEREFTTKEKAGLSVVIALAVSFNYLLFGMMHIFISNYSYFAIPFGRALLSAVALFFVIWVILSGLLIILPGRFFSVAASFTTGFVIAGYIQSNFMNSLVNLGALTGDAVNWHEYTMYTLLNLIIWVLILILPAVVKYFVPSKIWRLIIIGVCALLTGMQAASLVVNYISSSEQLQYEREYYLSREGSFEVSAKSNVIIFVVDRLDYKYIDAIRESNPAFFDRLDGFTDFTNAASMYEATFPAATFITTGIAYDYKMPQIEYYDMAWSQSQFIRALKDADYIMKYHMTGQGYIYEYHSQIEHAADNLKDGTPIPTYRSIISNLVTLSAYRHSPMALKPTFWVPELTYETTGDITDREYVTENDPLFIELLTENGLSVQNEKNNYLYVHLRGAHAPYTMDETGAFTGTSDVLSQTKGCFNILYSYMDEMKRLGVYDDSTIIILGDHGDLDYHIGFFVKPKGSAGTPLVQSNAPVSVNDNLLATIMKSEGLEYETYGVSAFDVAPDTPGERYVARWSRTANNIEFYKITGDIGSKDRDNWELTDSYEYHADLNVVLSAVGD